MSLSPLIEISGVSGQEYHQGELWIKWVCPASGDYIFDTTGNPPWNQPGFDGNFDFQTNLTLYFNPRTIPPDTVGNLASLEFSYKPSCNFPRGIGYSDGAKIAFAATEATEYYVHVTARRGDSGFFSFQWGKWQDFRLAKCNDCPPDWQGEICVASWQLQNINTNILHELGTFPAGNYKLKSCLGTPVNGIVVIGGPWFEQFGGAFNIWNDDQAYPAHFTLYDWVRELGGLGAYYNTQTGCADYYWQNNDNWEDISGTGGLGSIPLGLVGQPNPYPDESGSVVCCGSLIGIYPYVSGTPGHQNLNYSPCTIYPAGSWLGSYSAVLHEETGVTTELPNGWTTPAHTGCAVLVTLTNFTDGQWYATAHSWDLVTYQWSGRRAKSYIPRHRPYCGAMWFRVDHPLPAVTCGETDVFCHPGGKIGVALAGHEFAYFDLGDINPTVKLVAINPGVKYSLTSTPASSQLVKIPVSGNSDPYDFTLWLTFAANDFAAPMTWNWHVEATSGSFGTGSVGSGLITIVPGTGMQVFARLAYGVDVYTDGSVGPTYPLVVDLVFTDPCSGGEVARLSGYTFTPVVTMSNLGYLKDFCSLDHGYVYLRINNSGNAPLRNVTVNAATTAGKVGLASVDNADKPCDAIMGVTATKVFYNHGQLPSIYLRLDRTGPARITVTATDAGETIPPFIIDI